MLTRDQTRVPAVARVLGRAFVREPMMYWPMGLGGDLTARFTRCFAILEMALPLDVVWARARSGVGRLRSSVRGGSSVRGTTADRDCVATHDPPDPAWRLDTIAVAPELQGRGIGRALIEAWLERAGGPEKGVPSTGTAANVAIYSRCGFRVYDETDAPDGGPRIWFMR